LKKRVLSQRLGALASLFLLLGGCNGTSLLEADPGDPVLGFVGEELQLDASSSVGAVLFHWNFGDGSALSDTSPLATHSWEQPGHYRVVLEVEDSSGRRESAFLRVDVVFPKTEQPPQRSGRISTNADQTLLFAALPDFDSVAVIDRASRELSSHLSVCGRPVSVSHASDAALLAVACAESEEVEVWSTETWEVVQSLSFAHGQEPRAVLLRPDGELLVLTGGDGKLRSYDLTSVAIERWEVSGLHDPAGLAAGEGGLFVTRSRSPEDGGRWWWIPEGALADDAPVAESQVLRLDLGADSDTSNRGVPNYLHAPSLSPDGRLVVFPSLQANNQAGLYRDGLPLTHETTARAVLSRVLMEPGGIDVEGDRKIFDDRDFAVDAAFSPHGDWVYVAMLGVGTVDVLDAYSFETVGSHQDLGQGLRAVWLDSTGRELWVLSELTRELVGVGLEGNGEDGGNQEDRWVVDLRPGGSEVLSAEVLLGKQVFHSSWDSRMSRDGYLSCASCHLDGGQDGRVWDFTDRGEGLRNTPDLRGRAGAGSGPIHWSGNFDEIQDFEGDIRGAMGGRGYLTESDWLASSEPLGPAKAGRSEELDALAAYVQSLENPVRSPHREPDGAMTPEALAGGVLFESAELGCFLCHPLPTYTDSNWLAVGEPLLHDVGTIDAASGSRLGGVLEGIDTPSLLAGWDSAPYFHGGSAPTIRAVLEGHGHPIPEQGGFPLSEDELDQLEAFLLQLE